MPERIEFARRELANQIRDDPQFQAFIADSDDRRTATVVLRDATPEPALNDIAGRAADSRRAEAEKAGQAPLTDAERRRINFAAPGVNVPKARSIKAIAEKEGVDDWIAFADLSLTVDENRDLLKRAAREERGKRMGQRRDSEAARAQRLGEAFTTQQDQELDRAKDFALTDPDPEAQDFLRDQGPIEDVFDIGLRREPGRTVGQGEDFDRLVERHEQRGERATAIDERRTAEVTTNPFVWANNPDRYDFPGIDTVQPADLHDERSERARDTDRDELAPIADTREQWARHPDEFDWPGVDTPPEANVEQPEPLFETEDMLFF